VICIVKHLHVMRITSEPFIIVGALHDVPFDDVTIKTAPVPSVYHIGILCTCAFESIRLVNHAGVICVFRLVRYRRCPGHSRQCSYAPW